MTMKGLLNSLVSARHPRLDGQSLRDVYIYIYIRISLARPMAKYPSSDYSNAGLDAVRHKHLFVTTKGCAEAEAIYPWIVPRLSELL